jgi:hypothetical protein
VIYFTDYHVFWLWSLNVITRKLCPSSGRAIDEATYRGGPKTKGPAMRGQVVFHNTMAACLLRRIKVKAVGGNGAHRRAFVLDMDKYLAVTRGGK